MKKRKQVDAGPDLTTEDFADAIKAVQDRQAAFDDMVRMAADYRQSAERAGFSETVAEQMALHMHQVMMHQILTNQTPNVD